MLNSQTSDWETISSNVTHRSRTISFPYIHDSTNNSKSNIQLFANDTSLFSEICDPLETVTVNSRRWFLTQI